MPEKEKKVKVFMKNPEAVMQLKVFGKKSVEQSLKIMKTFDNACKEIREQEIEKTKND